MAKPLVVLQNAWLFWLYLVNFAFEGKERRWGWGGMDNVFDSCHITVEYLISLTFNKISLIFHCNAKVNTSYLESLWLSHSFLECPLLILNYNVIFKGIVSRKEGLITACYYFLVTCVTLGNKTCVLITKILKWIKNFLFVLYFMKLNYHKMKV